MKQDVTSRSSYARKRIVFVSNYFQILESYRPYILEFKKKFDVFVLASCFPHGSDYKKCTDFLRSYDVEGVVWHSKNKVDYPRNGKNRESRYGLGGFCSSILLLAEEKRNAFRYVRKLEPDIIIVSSDTRSFEKFLIQAASEANIPTVCFQWAMAAITRRLLAESKSEQILESDSKIDQALENQKQRSLSSSLSRIVRGVVLRTIKLRVKLSTGYFFGGGNATTIAAIGQLSKKFFSRIGISEKKIVVVGNALYEESVLKRNQNVIDHESIHSALHLPPSARYVALCMSSQKAGYDSYASRDKIYASWRRITEELLERNSGIYIVIKTHPRESLGAGDELADISERIRVTRDHNVLSIIAECSLLIVRSSTTGIHGMLMGKPVLSYNIPPLPLGEYYKELGGPLFMNDLDELLLRAHDVLAGDKHILSRAKKAGMEFLDKHLNIPDDGKHIVDTGVIPSIAKMWDLVDRLIKMTEGKKPAKTYSN